MEPVIELDGLGVRFGDREILKDLRISVSGRAIGLLGPNGAGKSTLIQTLLGFCPVASGTARIFGHDIRGAQRAIRTLSGYMPENESFIANMTAEPDAANYLKLVAHKDGHFEITNSRTGQTKKY